MKDTCTIMANECGRIWYKPCGMLSRRAHSPSSWASRMSWIARLCTTLSLSPLQITGETDATHFTLIEPPRKWRLVSLKRRPNVTDTKSCRCVTGGYLIRASGSAICKRDYPLIHWDDLSGKENCLTSK